MRRMHCNLSLAFLAIALLAKTDCDESGVELLAFEYKRLKLNFASPVPGVTRKCADGADVIVWGNDKICPLYREKFSNCGMSRDFAE